MTRRRLYALAAAVLTALPFLLAGDSAKADDATWYAVDHAADASGVSADFLHCLAGRESGHNPQAVNWRGNWHGVYQYLPSTWAGQSWRYGYGGASVYDGWANAHVTAAAIAANRGNYAWLRGQWPPSRWCGSPWW